MSVTGAAPRLVCPRRHCLTRASGPCRRQSGRPRPPLRPTRSPPQIPGGRWAWSAAERPGRLSSGAPTMAGVTGSLPLPCRGGRPGWPLHGGGRPLLHPSRRHRPCHGSFPLRHSARATPPVGWGPLCGAARATRRAASTGRCGGSWWPATSVGAAAPRRAGGRGGGPAHAPPGGDGAPSWGAGAPLSCDGGAAAACQSRRGERVAAAVWGGRWWAAVMGVRAGVGRGSWAKVTEVTAPRMGWGGRGRGVRDQESGPLGGREHRRQL